MMQLLRKNILLFMVAALAVIIVGIVLISSLSIKGYEYYQYYLRIKPVYVYLHIHNVSENTPLLGGKVLLNYVVIVRVENPYVNKSIMLSKVRVSLPENVYVQCGNNTTITATITLGKNASTTEPYASNIINDTVIYPRTIFDSWKTKKICAYGYTNDLFREGAYRMFTRDCVDCWIPGKETSLNYKYVIITGVVEVPKPWYYRLAMLDKPQYVVVIVEAKPQDKGYAEAVKILQVALSRVDDNTYVYSILPENVGFDLEGIPTQTLPYK